MHFVLAVAVSEILTFKTFDLQKVGHAQSTIFAMRTAAGKCQNLYKTPTQIFCASPYLFERYYFIIILPLKGRSRSRSAIVTVTPFDDKCRNLQMTPTQFCASSHLFRDINV